MVERRWRNFEAFLKDAIKDTRADIAEARKKPARSEDSEGDEGEKADDIDKIFREVERKLAAKRRRLAKAKKVDTTTGASRTLGAPS